MSTGPVRPAQAEDDLAAIEAQVQARRDRRLKRARRAGLLYPVAVIGLIGLAWEFGTRAAGIPPFILPPLSLIAGSFMAHGGLLLQHSLSTLLEIALGFGLSIMIGLPLAMALFAWPAFSRSVYPLLVSSQAVPKVAVAPLFVVWFGFGLLPKVLIAFLIAFFPIVINTVVGLESIEREKILLARSMGLSALDTFLRIRLPSALPTVFGGLKIAITLAVVGAVVGEFVGGEAGLGYVLMTANGSMDTPLLFAGVIALTVEGVLLFLLVELAERLAIPHAALRQQARSGETA
jgi:NitT/TauT family transport system permease protein